MTRKCHNHTLQTNPRHHEEEAKNINKDCMKCSLKVSMTRKCHNHAHTADQPTTPWGRDKECQQPHDSKLSNQLSLPRQDDCKLEMTLSIAEQNKDQTQPPTNKIQNRRDFYSVAWVMPQGLDFGALGVPRGSKKKFFQTWSCGISNWRGRQAEQNASNIFILGSNWWPWGEVKRSNIFNMSISKIFIPNSLCVFSQIKDRKHIEQNFNSVARVMPRGGTCGCWGGQKLKRGDLRWRPMDCAL